jgi:hypothetical protein
MEEVMEIPEVDEPGTEQKFVLLAPGTIASDYALRHLNKSLGLAQDDFGDAVKSAVNTYGGWQYTPLKAIIGAVRPTLTREHLTVSQFPVSDLEEKTITIYTRIVHWDSGEWMQNALELPAELALGKDGASKFNQQTIGGSITYAMKYAYKPIVGIPDGEEMIDSTDEKGDLPARKKAQATNVRAEAQQRADRMRQESSAISHPPQAQGAPASSGGSQPSTQRPAALPAAAQGRGGSIVFVPPNGLTATIVSARELPAEKIAELAKEQKRPWLEVKWLGKHNGCEIASCFDTKYWDLLKESVGLECHFQIKEADKDGVHYINILDVIFVDGQEYVEGKPVVKGDAQ